MNIDFHSTEEAFETLEREGIAYKQSCISSDTFKNKNPKSLGELIEETGIIIEERTKNIEFEEWEENGEKTPYDNLHIGIEKVKEIGKALKKLETFESNDLDWLLIGELIRIIASLLNHIKKTR
ncbi:MAG: hypothetical protein ABIN61_06290 [candidate division WOR-3 bacterium]